MHDEVDSHVLVYAEPHRNLTRRMDCGDPAARTVRGGPVGITSLAVALISQAEQSKPIL